MDNMLTRTHEDLRADMAVRALRMRQTMREARDSTPWERAQQAGEDVLAGILNRHRRGGDMAHDECGWCSEYCGCGKVISIRWPCPEVRAVLDAVCPTSDSSQPRP